MSSESIDTGSNVAGPFPPNTKKVTELPSYNFVKTFKLLLTELESGSPKLTYTDGFDPCALREIQRVYGPNFQLFYVIPEVFESKAASFYEEYNSRSAKFAEQLGETIDIQALASSVAEEQDLLESTNDAPVIKLINAILTDASKQGASDIHVESYKTRLIVRYRIDGILRKVVEPSRELGAHIISRIKIMAKLDIAEKRIPQDGRISIRIAGREIDIRVSTLPAPNGERLVLRILEKQAQNLNLSNLGMRDSTEKQFSSILHQPHGIVLITGPTGSGKTTTLYAGLSHINSLEKNILTIEDPIEYLIEGIGQSQVNNKTGYTFARGLRALLRQDPDVVMVGEIRDQETADISVQASLTGHLVLSTLHTNTAVGAVIRLTEMGVEPYLITSSLLAVIAQRLVRTLCEHCKTPVEPTKAELAILQNPENCKLIFKPTGCDACQNTGYNGRKGIYELIEITNELKEAITLRATETELKAIARRTCRSIRQDGIAQVILGTTSIDEVVRVTQGD